MFRGVNPYHARACLPKSKGKAPEESSSAGKKTETSGKKGKKPAYPEQPNGILKKGREAKVAGGGQGKQNPDQNPGTSNPKRVTFNPEVRKKLPLADFLAEPQSPRPNDSAPRLQRSESMPADMAAAHAANDREPLALPPKKMAQDEAGPSAPPSSPQASPQESPRAGKPAHHIPTLDQYLAENGAVPMTIADYLEQPRSTPNNSPTPSLLDSPNRMFPSREPSFELPGSLSSASTPERPGKFGAWDSPTGSSTPSARLSDDVRIPGTPNSPASPALPPDPFGAWYSGPSLPRPPAHLRAGWDSPSGSSAGSPGGRTPDQAHLFDTPSSPGSPANPPGPFGAWNSPSGSPAPTPRPEGQPQLTRTASEVGALFGNGGVETAHSAGAATAAPPAAQGDGRSAASGKAETVLKGAAIAAGVAGIVTTTVLLSNQGGDGE